MWREYLQVDRLAVDALVAASNSSRLILNLTFNIAEIREFSAGDVVKLSPLVPESLARVPVANVHGILGLILGDVD